MQMPLVARLHQASRLRAAKPISIVVGLTGSYLKRGVWLAVLGSAFVQTTAAFAQEFKSVSVNAAIMYDAPSANAKRVFIAPRGMPVQVVSVVEPFVKVRDMSGDTAWVDRRSLGNNRSLVALGTATLRAAAQDSAALVVQVERGVTLEMLDTPTAGWVRVKHSDGQTGFVKTSEVWGF
jgi:SH3-like domain-containing protein